MDWVKDIISWVKTRATPADVNGAAAIITNLIVLRSGTTTSDGDSGGATLVDATLIGSPDYLTGKTVLINSGFCIYQTRIASSFDASTGEVTFNPAFNSQVLAGVDYEVMVSAERDTPTDWDAVYFNPNNGVYLSIDDVISGTLSGPFTIGETVTGDVSSATGIVAAQDGGSITVVGISGPFDVTDTITGSSSGATVTAITTILPAGNYPPGAGPVGLPTTPSKNEIDVLAIISARKLSKVKIVELGGYTFTTFTVPSSGASGISFWGDGKASSVNLNGQNLNGCDFHYLALIGANGASNFSTAYNCDISITDNAGWDYFDCRILTPTIGDTVAKFHRCTFPSGSILDLGGGSTITLLGTGDAMVSGGATPQVTISGNITVVTSTGAVLIYDNTTATEAAWGAVDGIQVDAATGVYLYSDNIISGTLSAPFNLGETVTGTGGATGIVDSQTGGSITVVNIVGGFLLTDTITGISSGSTVTAITTIVPAGNYLNGAGRTGLPGLPCRCVSDASLITNARSTRVYINGSYDFQTSYTAYYIGRDSQVDGLNFNGQTVATSVFENLFLQGIIADGLFCTKNCRVNLLPGSAAVRGKFEDGIISGNILWDQAEMIGVHAGLIESDPLNVDFTGSPVDNWFDKITGYLNIQNLTAHVLDIQGDGLELTIDATCTGGVINVYGDVTIINHSGGTVVNDHTIQSDQVKSAATTIDLNQAAGDYDLLTGTAGVVELNSLVITDPNLIAGGALTSISIQTNDATPQVLIDSTTGGVANLTAEAQLSWQGRIRLGVGKKIQLTIGGGATGVSYVCDIDVEFKSLASAGYLA